MLWIISEIQGNKIRTYVSLTSLCDLVEKYETTQNKRHKTNDVELCQIIWSPAYEEKPVLEFVLESWTLLPELGLSWGLDS